MLALLSLQALLMSADVVKGRVVDADNGEPLEGAQVQCVWWEGHYGYMSDFTTDSCGVVTLSTGNYMCRVNMTIKYFGYEELKVKEFVAMGGKDTLDLGDLKMKMSAELMKELSVKGRARQFYMKGDTVVFNPEAFHLEDGARVSELMKKLPGVRIDDGKLTFNGKEVHLKMNGHDVTDDFLVAQLPAEAVQNVKAYERKSELAELTGMNDGQEQQILDIVIKPGFLDKWYGQTKASAYASPNYRLSANLHYLSESDPMGIYGRVSDNESRTGSVWDSGEWDYDNAVPQRQQYGKLSYQHNWKVKDAETSYNEDKWSISTTPSHLDTHQHLWINSETFLGDNTLPLQGAGASSLTSSSPSAFSNTSEYNYNHSIDLPLNFSTTIHLNPKTLMTVDASGGYSKGQMRWTSDQQTYRADAYSPTPQSLVNSSTSHRIDQNEKGNFHTSMYVMRAWEKSDFYANLNLTYVRNKDNSDNHAEFDYRELGTQETLDQLTQSHSNLFQTVFDTKYSVQLIPEKLKMGVGYWVDYWHKAEESDNLRNGVFDLANSFDRTKSYLVNEPRADVDVDLGKVWMHAAVKLQNVFEDFAYQRGKLDTVMHRNTWFPRPSFDFKWKSTKTTELKGNANWDYTVADMLESSAYVDDTNPLHIIMGNPNLRPSSNLRSSLGYTMMFVKGQQMLNWNLNYNRAFDPVASMTAYDAQTGGYTSMKANVDDRQTWRAGLSYDRTLGSYFRMQSGLNYTHTLDHGIKTVASISDPMEQYEQKVSGFSGNIRFSFENNAWELSTSGSCSNDKISYSDASLSGQNLWDYRVGIQGKYKLSHWTFNLDTWFGGHSGYLSDMMNRTRIALNASITWKTLKNKAQLTLSAKDILNQLDQVNYNISPTMRSENRTETFHRYLALTFTYNFDAKAKKK